MKKKALILAGALALAAFVVAQDAAKVELKENAPAPAFAMSGVDGKTYNNANLKGKVVLIDFWATWCGPCKAASPSIQALHEKFGSQGLVAIGANAFERENKDGAASAYAKEHNYTYLMTTNNDDLARSWGVKGIPTFVIIDKRGVVRKVQVGFSKDKTDKEMQAIIEKLLAE